LIFCSHLRHLPFRVVFNHHGQRVLPLEEPSTVNVMIFLDGHRQLTWDGPVPFNMPGPFFSNLVPRGCIISNSDGEFVVSNPPDDSDDLFDSLDPALSEDFQTFSDFLNDKVIDITFVVPSDINVPAAVSGFGAIFVDVDLEDETRMEFFDANGCKLATEYVPAEASGLSFAGVEFGQESIIALVRITLGTSSLSGADCYYDSKKGNTKGKNKKNGGGSSKGPRNVVVMDDFIYREPQAF
jgi:hypothetical protein